MSKTHYKKLDNPNYLGAYSLMDGEEQPKDLIVKITKVCNEDVVSANGTEQCKIAHFHGQKPMILNSINSKTIAKVVGSPYIEDWVGQNITLYVAKIKAFGESMEALRVRPTAPIIQLPTLSPDSPRWGGAKKSLEAGDVTLEAIKKNFTISKEHQALLTENI